MKKLLTLLLALVATTALWAEDFEVDGIYYNILTDKTNEVEVTFLGPKGSAYEEYSGSVTIPASVTYNGTTYSVTSIGVVAFASCSSLTSVTIPNSVTSIGNEAFRYCEGLISVTIGNSVTSIGWGAFYGCSSLTSVSIGNSVTSIGNFAFRDCSSLTSVTIGNSVTSIGDYAFYKCSGLTSIIIPNSVTSIGEYAFEGCSSLTAITIPNSVTSIGGVAFRNTGIYNDDSNWENGVLYISNCLIEVKPDQVAATYTIKDGTRVIADYAFYDCSYLTSITIPNSVTSIGDFAFAHCSGLTSVTIGNSVTSIGEEAFYGCSGLTSIVWNAKNYADFSSYSYAPFYGILSQITSFTFGDSVQHVPAFLCYMMSNLTSITIPNSVTSIGNQAFCYCEGLISVTIGNSVTSIGSSAFAYCSSLTSVSIGNSVTSIGDHAFHKCSGLTSIESLAETPPTLGSDAFYNVSTTIPVYVPCGSVSAYQSAEGWNAFTNIQCGSNEPSTDLENTHSPSPMANRQKLLRNGQLIILRDGKSYSVMGQEL